MMSVSHFNKSFIFIPSAFCSHWPNYGPTLAFDWLLSGHLSDWMFLPSLLMLQTTDSSARGHWLASASAAPLGQTRTPKHKHLREMDG